MKGESMAENTSETTPARIAIDATVEARAAVKAVANRHGLQARRVPDVLVSGWKMLTADQKGKAIVQALAYDGSTDGSPDDDADTDAA